MTLKTVVLKDDETPLAQAAMEVELSGASYVIEHNGRAVAMVIPPDPDAVRRTQMRHLGQKLERVARANSAL